MLKVAKFSITYNNEQQVLQLLITKIIDPIEVAFA